MKQEKIDALQTLLDAGTPGEWKSYWRENDEGHADCGVTASLREGMGYSVCRAPRFQKQFQWEIDGSLIAELHNLAPALLEAARENLRLREAVEEYRDSLGKIEMCSASMSAAWFEARKALGKETA